MVTNGGGVVITTDSHVNTNSGKDPKTEEKNRVAIYGTYEWLLDNHFKRSNNLPSLY